LLKFLPLDFLLKIFMDNDSIISVLCCLLWCQEWLTFSADCFVRYENWLFKNYFVSLVGVNRILGVRLFPIRDVVISSYSMYALSWILKNSWIQLHKVLKFHLFVVLFDPLKLFQDLFVQMLHMTFTANQRFPHTFPMGSVRNAWFVTTLYWTRIGTSNHLFS